LLKAPDLVVHDLALRLRAIQRGVEFANQANPLRTEKRVIAQNLARQSGLIVLGFSRAQGKVQQSPE
jgi:hypothetical protein